MHLRHALLVLLFAAPSLRAEDPAKPIEIGGRRELFVDKSFIDTMKNVRLQLETPKEEEVSFRFDKPWEGKFSGYGTVIKDGNEFRMYYRGRNDAGRDGEVGEYTCMAISKDGRTWTKPDFGLFDVNGSKSNNIVLADSPFTHNFSPMLDTRNGVPPSERYKALGGTLKDGGLVAFVSPDGIHWKKLTDQPVITRQTIAMERMPMALDSMNVPMWSESEQCYICYLRVFYGRVRSIARTTSKDFLTWTPTVLMGFSGAPLEQLYTNQTDAYFRAPHIYVGIAARFMGGRQVLNEEQAKEVNVDPKYFKDCSDGVLITTRGGDQYSGTFPEGFLTPGIGYSNWTSRTNYPSRGVIQSGPTEMSFFANLNYGQPSSYMRRYSLRLDGFSSAVAPYDGGVIVTKPLLVTGRNLSLNFATSAAGGIKVEIEYANGTPIPGFSMDDAVETIGNEIERVVRWNFGNDCSSLTGIPVRLKFRLKDAKLYSFQFQPKKG